MPHSRIDEKRIDELVSQMTLEEKVSLCHACSKFTVAPIERLGIDEFWMSDGPHGVREDLCRDSWMPANRDDDFVTYLPTGTALAATWDPEMATLHGTVLGQEARGRGKDVILGPGVNIMRTPICGRNFEYLGEDPYLASELCVAEIQAIQENDTAACVKHYALNNQELDRHGSDVEVDDRTLYEIYLPAFEAAVTRGEVLTLMGAYNLYRGQHCCHNERLLNQILKTDWGFDGLVVSDWHGTHNTEEAAKYGLDIEMGSRDDDYDLYYLGKDFREGIQSGKYPESLVDDKAKRVVRVMMAIGMLDKDGRKNFQYNTPENMEIARTIANNAITLLKNDDNILPLDAGKIKKLAVIGDNATYPQAYGGGSSAIKTSLETLPLDSIKALVGDDVEINFVRAYPLSETGHELIPASCLDAADGSGTGAWTVNIFDNEKAEGEAVAGQKLNSVDIKWDDDELPFKMRTGETSCTISAKLRLPEDGEFELAFTCGDMFHVKVNDEVVLAKWDFGGGSETATYKVEGKTGDTFDLELKFTPRTNLNGACRIGWITPSTVVSETESPFADAIAAASDADAVIFVGGLNHRFDSEGCDRPDMKLPFGQDALIAELLKVNPNTVITLIAGSPVEMPWADSAKAIVMGWYNGSHGGTALADMLFGKVNPSGKLPFTFPKKLEDTPTETIGGIYQKGATEYKEGIYVGYRWYDKREIEPLFAFGHGLSYTSFDYSAFKVEPGCCDCAAKVSLTVTNTGDMAGSEVVQIYTGLADSKIDRAVRELKGFDKVTLAPGESKQLGFEITKRALAYYDVESASWKTEAGTYTVWAGSSSRDLRASGEIEVN